MAKFLRAGLGAGPLMRDTASSRQLQPTGQGTAEPTAQVGASWQKNLKKGKNNAILKVV